ISGAPGALPPRGRELTRPPDDQPGGTLGSGPRGGEAPPTGPVAAHLLLRVRRAQTAGVVGAAAGVRPAARSRPAPGAALNRRERWSGRQGRPPLHPLRDRKSTRLNTS